MEIACINIDSDEILADGECSGVRTIKTVGENVAFRDVCYLKSDGKLWKTDADAEATAAGLLFFICETILADASGEVMQLGFARSDAAWDWTVAGELYLSSTPGAITQTAPSGSGDIVRSIGHATHADRICFLPSSTYVEIA